MRQEIRLKPGAGRQLGSSQLAWTVDDGAFDLNLVAGGALIVVCADYESDGVLVVGQTGDVPQVVVVCSLGDPGVCGTDRRAVEVDIDSAAILNASG